MIKMWFCTKRSRGPLSYFSAPIWNSTGCSFVALTSKADLGKTFSPQGPICVLTLTSTWTFKTLIQISRQGSKGQGLFPSTQMTTLHQKSNIKFMREWYAVTVKSGINHLYCKAYHFRQFIPSPWFICFFFYLSQCFLSFNNCVNISYDTSCYFLFKAPLV